MYRLDNEDYAVDGNLLLEPNPYWINPGGEPNMFRISFSFPGAAGKHKKVFMILNRICMAEFNGKWYTGNTVDHRFVTFETPFLHQLKEAVLKQFHLDENENK
jgi:hypothetical protein